VLVVCVAGAALDPLSDKIMMLTLTGSMAQSGLLPAPLAGLIVGRDVILLTAAFYYRYATLPPPFTWGRYFDWSMPTAEVRPTTTSKVNTAFQMVSLLGGLAAPVYGFVGHPALIGLFWTTGGTTVASLVSYIVQKDTLVVVKGNKTEAFFSDDRKS